jgi:murein DD-endopeptidase MepM/ murein hydrolase activator NlpD
LGLPVYSVLDGEVVNVLPDRPPYGNAVIIETKLDSLPDDWRTNLNLPEPPAALQPSYSLTCPPYSPESEAALAAGGERSIYLLYAHFNTPPLVNAGEKVTCGQVIGEVGTTGMSVNPHLHLETRAGPSGMAIAVMAHYEVKASESERQSYCTWRISGLFRPFDPISLLSLQP